VSQVAFGVKAHSGWAALVALAERGAQLEVIERRRLALVDAKDAAWAKAPYHAADGLAAADAEDLVARAVAAAHAGAERALAEALAARRAQGDEVVGCGVLLGTGMPGWSVREILAVHMRMHKAEGELFRTALAQGAERAGLRCIGVPPAKRFPWLRASASDASPRPAGAPAPRGRRIRRTPPSPHGSPFGARGAGRIARGSSREARWPHVAGRAARRAQPGAGRAGSAPRGARARRRAP
jgi:hypothetical protein